MSEVFRLLFIGREWSTDSGILGAALLGEEGKKKKTIKTLSFLFKKPKMKNS